MSDVKLRLEYLRKELRAQRISQSELNELESLAGHIDPGDTELLEAAGVPEFPGNEQSIKVIVTRSTGADKGVVVFVDSTFEPDGSDGGPGLRILVNDRDAYTGVAYREVEDGGQLANFRELTIKLTDIDYINGGLTEHETTD